MSFYLVTLDLTRSPAADYARVNETMAGFGFQKGDLPNTTFVGPKSRSEYFNTPQKFSGMLRAVFATKGIKVGKVLVCETEEWDLWVQPLPKEHEWIEALLNPLGYGYNR